MAQFSFHFKKISIIVLLLLSVNLLASPPSGTVYKTPICNTMTAITYQQPYKYEKRNGRLAVLATIALKTESGKSVKVLFDKRPMDIQDYSKEGIHVWLPLIDDDKRLQIYVGKQSEPVVDQLFSPLIPKDWGYFQNGTIYIISSSHQDIAWMNTPDSCRIDRIYNIINPAIDEINKNPAFTFEMEQTLNLMEFLNEFPNRKEEVIRLYKEGRFSWGATFNQPYEGLESGEQLIRQTYYGRKWIKENLPGCDDVTACNVDVPGRTWQMPQILAKSGIKNLLTSRMREGLYDWYSPDGSKIFTYTPGNYGWASMFYKFFDADAITAFIKLHSRAILWSDYFRSRNIPPNYAIVISNDAKKPVDYKQVVDEWNNIVALSETPLPKLKQSTSTEYFESVNVPGASMEKMEGDRPDLWLYIHGPAHYEAIKAKREAGVLLPAAEMFTTFNCLSDGNLNNYPRNTFDKAWMAAIYPDHGWGGKHGEITDSIFRASLEYARDEGKNLLNTALNSLAAKIHTSKDAIVVFNDLNWMRSDIVSVKIDEKEAKNMIIKDPSGKQLPAQIRKNQDGYEVVFYAENVPSLGYKTYYMATGKPIYSSPATVKAYSNYYENDFYKVTLGDGGIESLFDKQLNKELLNTTKFKGGDIMNMGYTGNGAGEFVQIVQPAPYGDIFSISDHKAFWKIVEEGPLFSTYENVQNMKQTDVIQRMRIYHGTKKIDFDVTLVNFDGTHNRQFRIGFPLNMRNYVINYEVPMGVLQVGRDEMKNAPGGWSWIGTYEQLPKDIYPREIQNFISANGEGFGVTLSSCVAVADWVDPSREKENYPVLQGILLSSHKSCHGEGNWYEQKGQHQYTFSLTSHTEGWQNGYHFGIEANHPLHVVLKPTISKGELPEEMSFISTSDHFVQITTVKKSDNNNDIIMRLVEMGGRDAKVNIEWMQPVKQLIRANMIEEDETSVPEAGKSFVLPVGHHAIETYKLKF